MENYKAVILFFGTLFLGYVLGAFTIFYGLAGIAKELRVDNVQFSINETTVVNAMFDRMEEKGLLNKLNLPNKTGDGPVYFYTDIGNYENISKEVCCYPPECGVANPPDCSCTYPVFCYREPHDFTGKNGTR